MINTEFSKHLKNFLKKYFRLGKVTTRVWTPPPYPMGPHGVWGWGIDLENPRGRRILTQTPWGFGGDFDAFLGFSGRKKILIFTRL